MSKHYIKASDLFEEFKKSKELGYCTNDLLGYFRKIAKHFSTTFHYVNQIDCKAVVEFAISEAWRKWDYFDPDKSNNIFSFYTTMIANDMKLHYKQITRGKTLNISIDSLFTPKE